MDGALLRIGLPDFAWPRPGPRVRAGALALGAVLLWSTWPLLATLTSPAPPLLAFGLAALVGCTGAFARAWANGQAGAFLRVPWSTLLFVAGGLFLNNILYLLAIPRIGPAEANVVAYLWPVMLVGLGALVGRSRLSVVQGAGIAAAFLGAAVVIGPRLDAGFDLGGVALAFASGAVFAVFALVRSYGRESGDVVGPSMGLIALASLGAHALFEAPAALDAAQLAAIVCAGLAPLWFSNMLWDRASRTGELALISGIAYFTPLCALALLALTGVAAVTAATGLGAVLIVLGALLAAGLMGGKAGGMGKR